MKIPSIETHTSLMSSLIQRIDHGAFVMPLLHCTQCDNQAGVKPIPSACHGHITVTTSVAGLVAHNSVSQYLV